MKEHYRILFKWFLWDEKIMDQFASNVALYSSTYQHIEELLDKERPEHFVISAFPWYKVENPKSRLSDWDEVHKRWTHLLSIKIENINRAVSLNKLLKL